MTPDDHRYASRARALWPGLDATRLRRAQDDPRRIARLVARRTTMPDESILQVLLKADAAPEGAGRDAARAGARGAGVVS